MGGSRLRPSVQAGLSVPPKRCGDGVEPARDAKRMRPSDGTADVLSGVVARHKGKFGFIEQDSGDDDLFVMPGACESFGGLPPIGTRVAYTIVIDPKTGRPRAGELQPEVDSAPQLQRSSARRPYAYDGTAAAAAAPGLQGAAQMQPALS